MLDISLIYKTKPVETSYHFFTTEKEKSVVNTLNLEIKKKAESLASAGESLQEIKLFDNSTTHQKSIFLEVTSSETFPLNEFRKLGNSIIKSAKKESNTSILIDWSDFPSFTSTISESDALGALVEGLWLGFYSYDYYKTNKKEKSNKKNNVSKIYILTSEKDKKQKGDTLNKAIILSTTQNKIRDLVNAPSNELTPVELANRCKKSAKAFNFSCKVLNKKEISSLKMGGLLGVNKGSANEPVFIIAEHKAKSKKAKTVVLVGKAITFDTGGISIKPSAGMGEMKGDMAGGAAVIGAVEAAARLNLDLNVIGLIPSTDNMPSGSATCPGDILTSMSGLTIEVDNTDAEGRLILCDALFYARRYKPDYIIDLATLTGACVVSLAHFAAGVMSNNDDLVKKLVESGNQTFERVWQLPMWDDYDNLIKSDVADVKNVGGRWGGAITAGKFLQRFIEPKQAWAHIDIAGPSFFDAADSYQSKGGTGFGVRLLIDFFQNLKS